VNVSLTIAFMVNGGVRYRPEISVRIVDTLAQVCETITKS